MAQLDGAHASLTTTVDASGMRIFSIAGELDLSNVPAIEGELAQLIEGAAPPITFDFSQLDFMDSSGIAMLLRVVNESGPISIRNAPRTVRVIIDATGLGDVLRVSP
jgi:anti-anti-sigma factor